MAPVFANAGLELAAMTDLRRISINDARVADLRPLASLAKLEEVELSRNDIGSIEALAGLTVLSRVWLAGNHVRDLSALQYLVDVVWRREIDLYVAGNGLDARPGTANRTLCEALRRAGAKVYWEDGNQTG